MKYIDAFIVGLAVGGPYSLVGTSLTLMFRTTGLLSFAHAGFAMVAGFLFGELASSGWPVPLAAGAAIVASVGLGLVAERVAIRPVARASAPVKLIVTLGILAVITGLVTEIFGTQPAETPLVFPKGSVAIGSASITYQQLGILAVTVVVAMVLRWFLRATRFGTAIRAVQANPEASELMGVEINRVDQFNWAFGGLLSGLVGVLLTPLIGATVATYPLVLAKALAGTLFGGLVSLPLTLVGGLAVGVIESEARVAFAARGAPELAVLLAVTVLLFTRRSWRDDGMAAAWASSDEGRFRGPLAARLEDLASRARSAGTVARRAVGAGIVVLVVAGSFVAANSEYWGVVGALSLFYAIEALSMVVLTGWGGQVSLMHGGYVGIGAFVTAWLVGRHGWPLELAIPATALLGVAFGSILGIPALRLNGVQFAIASTIFAAAATSWLFELPGLPRNINRGTLFSIDLFDTGNVYVVMLVVTALLYGTAWLLRRSIWWRLLIASRDIPVAVRHAGLRPGAIRMIAFSVASFMATLGGVFFGILATSFNPLNFSIALSFSLLLFAVAGGLETLLGPVVAALCFGLLPQLLQGESGANASSWPDVAAGVLVIGLLALRPSGLGSLLTSARSRAAGLRFGRFDAVISPGGLRRSIGGTVPADRANLVPGPVRPAAPAIPFEPDPSPGGRHG